MKTGKQRIFTRARFDATRYYADFRDYADVGGGREALKAPGMKRATTDPKVAEVLAAKRLHDLDRLRAQGRGRQTHGLPEAMALEAFASVHLKAKAESGAGTDRWLAHLERMLRRAVDHFGASRDLESIVVADMRRYGEQLRASGLSGGTARHYLNALSNLYRRAQAEGHVPPGFNPVAALMEKPSAQSEEARWLEVHEAALLLEAARTYQPKRTDLAVLFAYPLIATFLLTGGRRAEVLGLEVGDVSFDRKTVTFRKNERRRLKTRTSYRTLPLWPQLEDILRPYVFGRPLGRLLFPSYRTGAEAPLTDERKILNAVAVRAGWKPGEITSKMFRHTYCAARAQTLDNGAPVSEYTVQRELGHSSPAMVRRVYLHLGQVRHRAEAVEYRADQHAELLGQRLTALGTVSGTVEGPPA